MKRYRNLILLLLILLLFVGMPLGLLMDRFQRDEAGRDLILSIKLNDLDGALADLRAGADPNLRDSSADNPPSFAERMKQLFQRLLHPNKKPDTPEEETALTLFLQTAKPDNPLFVKALLDAGADPNLKGMGGETPLLNATGLGADGIRSRKDSVRLLVQRGADVNAKTSDGWSVLYFAVVQNDLETVQSL